MTGTKARFKRVAIQCLVGQVRGLEERTVGRDGRKPTIRRRCAISASRGELAIDAMGLDERTQARDRATRERIHLRHAIRSGRIGVVGQRDVEQEARVSPRASFADRARIEQIHDVVTPPLRPGTRGRHAGVARAYDHEVRVRFAPQRR